MRMRDYFEDDLTPPTQSSSARVPPPKVPGTAIATEMYMEDPNAVRRLVARMLDAVDSVADTVAEGLGLRHT
jgi:hypothetical protein